MHALLDTAEAARRCNLARSTLAKLRVSGSGAPYLKLGSKVVYRADQLEQWIQSHGQRRSTSERSASGAEP